MKAFFRQNRLFAICGILAVVIVLIAVFAPWIAPHDPYETIMQNALRPPSAAQTSWAAVSCPELSTGRGRRWK